MRISDWRTDTVEKITAITKNTCTDVYITYLYVKKDGNHKEKQCQKFFDLSVTFMLFELRSNLIGSHLLVALIIQYTRNSYKHS